MPKMNRPPESTSRLAISFAVVIGSLMVPIQVTIVPLFLVMSKLGLTNTLWALILPGIFSAFGIFLLRQHFLTLPRELEEAARIDGAGHLRTFVRVVLPLSGPSLATLGIRYLRLDEVGLAMATIVVTLPLVLPLVWFMIRRLSKGPADA